MNPLAFTVGVFGLLFLASRKSASSSSAALSAVTINGHNWLLEKGDSKTITTTTQAGQTNVVEQNYIVYAPKFEYGPHAQMPVIAFSQAADNPASRKLTARYPDVPVDVTQYAIDDFQVTASF